MVKRKRAAEGRAAARPAAPSRQGLGEPAGQGGPLAGQVLQPLPGGVLEGEGQGHQEAVGPPLQLLRQGGKPGEQHGQAGHQPGQLIPGPPKGQGQKAQQGGGQRGGTQGGGPPPGQAEPPHEKANGGLQQGGQPPGQQKGEQPGQQEADAQPQPGQGQGGVEEAEQEA